MSVLTIDEDNPGSNTALGSGPALCVCVRVMSVCVESPMSLACSWLDRALGLCPIWCSVTRGFRWVSPHLAVGQVSRSPSAVLNCTLAPVHLLTRPTNRLTRCTLWKDLHIHEIHFTYFIWGGAHRKSMEKGRNPSRKIWKLMEKNLIFPFQRRAVWFLFIASWARWQQLKASFLLAWPLTRRTIPRRAAIYVEFHEIVAKQSLMPFFSLRFLKNVVLLW